MINQTQTRGHTHKRQMKISAVSKLMVMAACFTLGYTGVSTVRADTGTSGANGANATDTTHNPAIATGGNGGNGGTGTYLNGGGNGGSGGTGGNAYATVTSGIPYIPFGAANTAKATGGYGGNGGSAYNINYTPGSGAVGGNAEAGINIGTATNPYNGNIIGGGAYATSGYGGSGFQGANGGNATIDASSIYATGDVALTTVAAAEYGGRGATSAGNGGTASLASGPIFGQSTAGGNVHVEADLTGGTGGYGVNSTSTGGNGIDATLGSSGSSAVLGSTTGALTLTQSATGGAAGGGEGSVVGTAGNASSIMDLNFNTLPSRMTPSSLVVNNTAKAGDGGYGGAHSFQANGSNAGTSYAESTITTATGIDLNVTAAGGNLGGGASGATVGNAGNGSASTALATGTVTNNGNLTIVSTGQGSLGGFSYHGNGGQGGNGVAVATGTGDGSGSVAVNAYGNGGTGGRGSTTNGFIAGSGGTGTATAVGIGDGSGSVTVGARAYGGYEGGIYTMNGQQGGDLTGGNVGSGTAMATATGLASSNVNASAGATSAYGGGTISTVGSGPALADAYATGLGGTSMANSTSRGGAVWSVRALASAPVVSGATAHTQAFAITMGPTRNSSNANGIQAVAYASAMPSNSDANAALASSPNVRSNFNVGGNGTGPVSDVVGLMTLAANNMSTGSATTYHSEVDWNINPAQLAHGQQNILVGLLNASSSGTGTVSFALDLNGTTTTELNAASFSAADAFFTDTTLNLGAIGTSTFTLNFLLDVTPTSNGATFDPNIIFGNATMASGPAAPEPAALALMALGGLTLLLRRRRTA